MFGLISKALGGRCHEAQAMALREIVEMSGANPRKVHDLCVGEDFLARFNRDHGSSARRLWSHLHFLRIRTPEVVVL